LVFFGALRFLWGEFGVHLGLYGSAEPICSLGLAAAPGPPR